jgi:hypothetical protein
MLHDGALVVNATLPGVLCIALGDEVLHQVVDHVGHVRCVEHLAGVGADANTEARLQNQ